MEEMKNNEQDCKTKAELMDEIAAYKDELAEMTKDKNYWCDAWRKEYNKTKAYEERLKKLQHTVALLASTIGEIDITALAKEENV